MAAEQQQQQPQQSRQSQQGASARRRVWQSGNGGGSGVLEMSRNPSGKPRGKPQTKQDDLTDLTPTLPQIPSLPRLRAVQATPPRESPPDAPRETPQPGTPLAPLDSRRLRIAADWSAYVIARDWLHDDRLAGVSSTARMRMFSLLGRLYLPVTEAAQRLETPEHLIGRMAL